MGFESFFVQSITVYAYTGFDSYANPVWSTTGSTYAAFVLEKMKSIRDKAGVDKISNTQIYLDGSVSINIEDKITLPSGEQPIILAVQRFPDFTGDYVLTEVFT